MMALSGEPWHCRPTNKPTTPQRREHISFARFAIRMPLLFTHAIGNPGSLSLSLSLFLPFLRANNVVQPL